MKMFDQVRQYAVLSMAALLLASCSGQKAPAGKLVGDIEATVIAASSEAAKYIPGQLLDVQTKLDALKAAYDKQDYAEVVTNGPALLRAAEELATAAAAKKDEVIKSLEEEWTALAGALPAQLTAIQGRIDVLGRKSSKKLASGIDLDAAKAGAADAASLWSKAQAAFAAGNLDEAVLTAKDVKAKLAALAETLKMDPAAMAVAAA
jgi:hypothetical protein